MKWQGRRQSGNVEVATPMSEAEANKAMLKQMAPLESPEEIKKYKQEVERGRLKERTRFPDTPYDERSDWDKFHETATKRGEIYSSRLPQKAPIPTPRPNKGYMFFKGGKVR